MSGGRTNPPQSTTGEANSLLTTPHPPYSIQRPKQRKKRTREETAGHEDKTLTEEPRKKKNKKKKSAETIDSTPLVSATVETVVKEEIEVERVEKERKKSKKRKHTSISSEGASAVDHGLNSTADGSAASEPHQELSSNASLHQFNNNDDILRVFQSLDFSRLAGVLKSLEIPTAGVDLGTNDYPFTALLDSNDPIEDQATFTDTENPIGTTDLSESAPPQRSRVTRAVPSAAAKPSPKVSKPTPKTNPTLPAVGPSIANPKHTELLATKWLSATKLKELVQSEGLVYKKGKFTSLEQHSLNTAVENYRVNNGLSQEQLIEIIFSKATEDHADFWPEITASVPARPIIAVYHYVHRAYNPLGFQGKWTKGEDAALICAVQDLGSAWQKVKNRVGRSAQDCRDRWRNHLVNRSERQRGPWSKEEEEELTSIVQELTIDQGKNTDNDIFWGVVSQRMGNKRGRQQCRIKWTDALNKTIKNGGETPRWNKQDSYLLVSKIASLDIQDESEIKWQTLRDDTWNLWSTHILQRQWRRLTHAIKGHEKMSYQDILQILKQKNPLPASPKRAPRTPRPPKKMPKSAPVIEDDECESEGVGEVDG